MKIYWPEMNVNTLYSLEPGKSYFVFSNSAISFTFPDCE